MQRPRLCATLMLAPCALGAIANAAEPARAGWPERPIRYIVPFAPGGPTDILSRAVGERLSQSLGTPVVVDNRAGAGGGLGAELVARAAADGSTTTRCAISSRSR
jgi:tripartite-type tricarboxylate transporter receptor subunit TctC